MWLSLTTSHWQTWLFSSTSTYHSTDLLTARGVAHLVVYGTSGSTSYETIPSVRLESSGGVLSTVDMVVQRRDGPRRLCDDDDDDEVHVAWRCVLTGVRCVWVNFFNTSRNDRRRWTSVQWQTFLWYTVSPQVVICRLLTRPLYT